MIAKLALSTLLFAVLLYAWRQYRRAPAIGLFAMAAAAIGLYFVWNTGQATRLAEIAGIGRGVDLFLYLWVVISLLMLLNLHLRLRMQTEIMTELARSIALSNARAAAPPKPQ
jgi:small membrane protein